MISYFANARRSYFFPEGPEVFLGDSGSSKNDSIRLNPKEFIQQANNLQPSVLWLREEKRDIILNFESNAL